jgi:ubiquinone/menaquinone biosynthesis C-methylase UbiE
MNNDFSEIAAYYDDLYVKPEQYRTEAEKVKTLIETYKLSKGNSLLDLACGTGGHIPYWRDKYDVTGLDISTEMLALARGKYPDVEFVLGDMIGFSLSRQFDALVCLYGSIGFVRTPENLKKALQTFSLHLKHGGVLCLTPWSTKEEFIPKIVVDTVKHPHVRIARMENVKLKTPGIIEVEFHHLIGRDGKVTYHKQSIEIGLFSRKQYSGSINEAGLKLVDYYQGPDVPMGAFIVRKP